jgi:hypothetical protein
MFNLLRLQSSIFVERNKNTLLKKKSTKWLRDVSKSLRSKKCLELNELSYYLRTNQTL